MEGNVAFVFFGSMLALLVFVVVNLTRLRPFSEELFDPPAVERSPDPAVYSRLSVRLRVGATDGRGALWSWPLCGLRLESDHLVIKVGPLRKRRSVPLDDICTVSRHGVLLRGNFRLFLIDRSIIDIFTWRPWFLNRILQGLGLEVRKTKRNFSGFDRLTYP